MNQYEKDEYEKNFEFHPIEGNPLILDFKDCEDIYQFIKQKFGLPIATGENWNGIWDFLEDALMGEESLTVVIKNFDSMSEHMRELYEDDMFRVFHDIHKQFPQITFERIS